MFTIDEATLYVAKLMGHSREDLERYGFRDTIFHGQTKIDGSTLAVAKLMGNTEEDLIRYGYSDEGVDGETDEEKIKRLLGAD